MKQFALAILLYAVVFTDITPLIGGAQFTGGFALGLGFSVLINICIAVMAQPIYYVCKWRQINFGVMLFITYGFLPVGMTKLIAYL